MLRDHPPPLEEFAVAVGEDDVAAAGLGHVGEQVLGILSVFHRLVVAEGERRGPIGGRRRADGFGGGGPGKGERGGGTATDLGALR